MKYFVSNKNKNQKSDFVSVIVHKLETPIKSAQRWGDKKTLTDWVRVLCGVGESHRIPCLKQNDNVLYK